MDSRPRPRVTAGRRENAAGEGATRRLTGPRRAVLSILEHSGPGGADDIAERWRALGSEQTTSLDDLAALVSRLLWKLEALGWVEPTRDGYVITSTGVEALDKGVTD
jgi:hypothetical protein